jgi:phosphatidate cytidylyltransferase
VRRHNATPAGAREPRRTRAHAHPPAHALVPSPLRAVDGCAGFCTVLFAFATPVIYAQMPFLICPADELNPFSFDTLSLTCDTPKVFVPTAYKLTWLTNVMPGGAPTIELLPIQLHALSIGLFASVVAPFGGFFASGIKRAYKLDDFASIIPGHVCTAAPCES